MSTRSSRLSSSARAILTATENGYGKRTPVDDFPVQGRGGQGVIAIQTSERNGELSVRIQVERRRRDHADQFERHAGAHRRERYFDQGATPRVCA